MQVGTCSCTAANCLVLAPALQWMRLLFTCCPLDSFPASGLDDSAHLEDELVADGGAVAKALGHEAEQLPRGEALDTDSNMLLDGDGEHGVLLGQRVQAQARRRICCQGCRAALLRHEAGMHSGSPDRYAVHACVHVRQIQASGGCEEGVR